MKLTPKDLAAVRRTSRLPASPQEVGNELEALRRRIAELEAKVGLNEEGGGQRRVMPFTDVSVQKLNTGTLLTFHGSNEGRAVKLKSVRVSGGDLAEGGAGSDGATGATGATGTATVTVPYHVHPIFTGQF